MTYPRITDTLEATSRPISAKRTPQANPIVDAQHLAATFARKARLTMLELDFTAAFTRRRELRLRAGALQRAGAAHAARARHLMGLE